MPWLSSDSDENGNDVVVNCVTETTIVWLFSLFWEEVPFWDSDE